MPIFISLNSKNHLKLCHEDFKFLKNRNFIWASIPIYFHYFFWGIENGCWSSNKTREKTIDAMIYLCYLKHHGTKDDELCPECNELFDYAILRLSKYPFQKNKSTCGKCLVHCYKPDMRTKVTKGMRYSEPRMLLHHPILALHHVFDGRKKPEPPKKKSY